MEFGILGPLEAVADGKRLAIPSGQQRALLALLVLNANRVLSPDRIVEAVWGDEPPASGTRALAFHVSRLRDALAPGRQPGGGTGGLETEAGGYVLRVDPDAIDAVRFERLAREGHRRLPDDPAAARAALVEALGLWRGEALADVAYAEFAQAEIRRLDELRLGALEDRLEADLALGGHTAAVGELGTLLAANPLDEHLRCLLMLALYRSGRQAEALRVVADGRRRLSEELGIDPGPELTQLEARILAQDRALDLPITAGAPRPRARNPYKGLRPFAEADSGDFFGREALVERLLTRLGEVAHDGRLLVIVGPSGSGKSSVVRAGLIPALRAGTGSDGRGWRIVTMAPGVAPFRELAAGLGAIGRPVAPADVDAAERAGDLRSLLAGVAADGEPRLLLVIDQLEELFVRVDEDVRDRFLGGLVAALDRPALPLVIVATLRADFLHVPLALPDVGPLVRDGTELVTPLTRAELERAIVRPAESVGVEVDPALVVEIVGDVERRPGVLPLLEYALTELFDRSDGRRLTREGYEAIGGAIGALGRQADDAWRALDAGGREIAQQVLLALLDVGENGGATARRVRRPVLDSIAGPDTARVRAVVDGLGRRGLLTFDVDPVTRDPTVQIAHEALLVHWPRLEGWIEDLQADLAMRRRLSDAAREWEAGGRSIGDLAIGPRLARFQVWAHDARLRLGDAERAFLSASTAEQTRQARRARAVRRGVVGAVAAGVLLTVGLSVALVGRSRAEAEQAEAARAREVEQGEVARARELAVASLGTKGELRLLLALQAGDVTAGRGYVVEEAYDALQWALQDARVPFPAGSPAVGVRAAPDGARGVFLLDPEVLMRLAAGRAGRHLTGDECRAYVRADACPPVQPPVEGSGLGVRTVAGVVPAASLAVDSLLGTRVSLLSELPGSATPLAGLHGDASGMGVAVTAGADGALRAAIVAGELPDVAIVARPSVVGSAARDGLLVDLEGRVDLGSLAADDGTYLMRLGQAAVGGSAGARQVGAPIAASVDSLLWYPADAFALNRYEPPRTPVELDALIRTLRDDGRVPWCFGTRADSETETGAAAWVEDLYLGAQGLDGYDRWVRGDARFETPEMHAAADALGGLLMPRGAVLNGLDSALLTEERIAGLPMVAVEPPGCWLLRGASTDAPLMAAGATAVPYPLTAVDSRVVLGRVYQVVLLRDRPEARRLVQELIAETSAAALAAGSCGSGVFALRPAPLPAGCALAATERRLRGALAAGMFRARAVDALPGMVGQTFQGDLVGYLWRWKLDGISSASTGFAADLVWDELRTSSPP